MKLHLPSANGFLGQIVHSCNRDQIEVGRLPQVAPEPPKDAHILICGWTDNVIGMLGVLNLKFDEGTHVHVLSEVPAAIRRERFALQGVKVAES